MAKLKLTVKGQLQNLVPVSGNLYKFIIQYLDQSNNLLSNPELNQNEEVTVSPIGNTFNLSYSLANGSYTIPNVIIKLYNNSVLNSCSNTLIRNINVNCGTNICSPEVNLTGTVSQNCADLDTVVVNGTSLTASGGTAPYQYSFIKTSNFTDVTSLTWSSTKTWNADENTEYRVYVRGSAPVTNSTCYDYITVNTINCTEPATECDPVVNIVGTPVVSCQNETTSRINASVVSATGGNNSYQWAIIKESDFTNVAALTWGSVKTWDVDHNDTYRLYVRDTSTINTDPTCYDYITVITSDCSEVFNCTEGPDLTSILSNTNSTLQFGFNGSGVTTIDWRIKSAGTTVRLGSVNPSNNTPSISFSTLSPGNYTLEIEGGNCISDVSTLPFTVEDEGGNEDLLIMSGYFGV